MDCVVFCLLSSTSLDSFWSSGMVSEMLATLVKMFFADAIISGWFRASASRWLFYILPDFLSFDILPLLLRYCYIVYTCLSPFRFLLCCFYNYLVLKTVAWWYIMLILVRVKIIFFPLISLLRKDILLSRLLIWYFINDITLQDW